MYLLFKNKKVKALELEINKLNDDLLETKKSLLKVTEEQYDLLSSSIDIINDAIENPELRSECLLKLDKYNKKETQKESTKFIYIITIDEYDKYNFLNNYCGIAKDLDLKVECKFVSEDYGDLKYKIVFLCEIQKAKNINNFWKALNNILEDSIFYTCVN